MRRIYLFTVILIFAILIGCSSGGESPISPSEISVRNSSSNSNHMLWGLYQFTADPVAQTLDVVTLRMADMHLNALPFLEPPANVYLSLESVQFNGSVVDANIGLRHPFLGLTEFTGFDVCGTVITNGSISGFTDSGIVIPGLGDVRLLNADGHSRWWNPSEFPSNAGISGYKDGLLGAPDSLADFSGTVNGYKYFCDDLTDPDDPLSNVDPENRGVFNAGQKNIRHYSIDISSGLIFNYAIDASWTFPNGDSPWEAPGSFPAEANRIEPWWIDATIVDNYLWNDGIDSGGLLELSFDVYDWSNIDLDTVSVESPGNLNPVFDVSPTGGGDDYSTYEVEFTNAIPGEDEIQVLITVETEQENFQGFISGTNTSAYLVLNVPVSSEPSDAPVADGTVDIEPYFDGFGPIGTISEPVPTEWPIHLDASSSSGPAVEFFWELNGDDLYDDAEGMIVTASFPDPGTHTIKLKVTNGSTGVDYFDLPGSYEVVDGTYAWAAFSGTSDGSKDNPWTDIPDALTDVGTDGFICVRGDDGAGGQCVYDDDLTLTSTYQGTRIQGYYGDVATDEPPNQTGYIKIAGSNLTIDGFEVTGPSVTLYTPYNHNAKIGTESGNNVLIRHLYIHDINQTASLCKAIFATTAGSLTVENVLETELAVSRIANGIHYGDPTITIKSCTFDRFGTATYVGGFYRSGGNAYMTNTIWTDLGATDYYYICKAGGILDFDYSCTSDTTTPPDGGLYFFQVIPGTGCITSDPLYVDPYSDHHLGTGSPCIDTGDPAITDYDDSLSDMGCYGGPWGDWDFEN